MVLKGGGGRGEVTGRVWEWLDKLSKLSSLQGVPLVYTSMRTIKLFARILRIYILLFRMGYVTDNCIDWDHFNLPKKSDLQKLLLQNILNRV